MGSYFPSRDQTHIPGTARLEDCWGSLPFPVSTVICVILEVQLDRVIKGI